MILFDDSVTASHLPTIQKYGVYYVDGEFANEREVRERLPRARLYGITVNGRTGHDVFAADCEKGDLTPAQAVEWVAKQVELGIPLICVYANMSTWKGGLEAKLAKYGRRIKRWVAQYNGVARVPLGFNAKQYEGDVKPGDDRNIADDDFFEAPAFGIVRFEGSLDLLRGIWSANGVASSGPVNFGSVNKEFSSELQLKVGTMGEGIWRIKDLPANAKPLGD